MTKPRNRVLKNNPGKLRPVSTECQAENELPLDEFLRREMEIRGAIVASLDRKNCSAAVSQLASQANRDGWLAPLVED